MDGHITGEKRSSRPGERRYMSGDPCEMHLIFFHLLARERLDLRSPHWWDSVTGTKASNLSETPWVASSPLRKVDCQLPWVCVRHGRRLAPYQPSPASSETDASIDSEESLPLAHIGVIPAFSSLGVLLQKGHGYCQAT